jgi:hypothetical protein
VARPTMLTRARHERIIDLLRDGVPFATACRTVGVSPSAGYEWLYRGWGTHPDRPPTARYVAFARAVDAVFPGGFAERYEDEFVEAQSSDGTESALAQMAQPRKDVSRPQSRCETGEAGGFSEFPEPGEGFAEGFCEFRDSVTRAEAPPAKASESQRNAEFAEVTEPTKSDTPRDRARTREEDGDKEPRHAPMPWLSQRSRERSILDMDF